MRIVAHCGEVARRSVSDAGRVGGRDYFYSAAKFLLTPNFGSDAL